ncbi:hypothetical protein Q5752_000217 [Cryptotrichosporon argae]
MPPTPITLTFAPSHSHRPPKPLVAPYLPPPAVTRPTPSQRRKPRSPFLADAGIALTPLNAPLLARCLPSSSSSSSSSSAAPLRKPSPSASSPRRVTTTSTQTFTLPLAAAAGVGVPYSRATDLANTRSARPSPQERLRASRAELERARAKRESAALARQAAAGLRRRKGRRGASAGGTATPTATGSPDLSAAAGTSASTHAHAHTYAAEPKPHAPSPLAQLPPAIHTEPASDTPSPAAASPGAPFAPASGPRGALKRTRSAGLLSIATNAANVLGRSLSIGSPLKAEIAIGHDDGARKRARPGSADAPHAHPADLDPAPAPAPHTPAPVAHVGLGLGLAPAELGVPHVAALAAQPMRRAVSANGVASADRTRVARLGSAGPGTDVRERSRREVVLPARMRDYDMKAVASAPGTPSSSSLGPNLSFLATQVIEIVTDLALSAKFGTPDPSKWSSPPPPLMPVTLADVLTLVKTQAADCLASKYAPQGHTHDDVEFEKESGKFAAWVAEKVKLFDDAVSQVPGLKEEAQEQVRNALAMWKCAVPDSKGEGVLGRLWS